MAVVRQLQLLLKLLRHVLSDSVARPCLLYVFSLIRHQMTNLNAFCAKLVRRFAALISSPKDKKTKSSAVHHANDCSPLPIYPSRFYPNPFFGPNVSRSSQDLGLVSVERYASENVSNSRLPCPEPDPSTQTELSIVIDSPSANQSEDRIETLSPEEMIFDRTAGDLPAITDTMLSAAHTSFYPITPEGLARYYQRATV